MKGNGIMIYNMVMGKKYGLMGTIMRAITNKARKMDKVNTDGRMAANMKEYMN